MSRIRIRLPDRSLGTRAHGFHLRNAGEFLFPRDHLAFQALVADYSVLVATKDDNIVGLCYITEDESEKRWEFGGVIPAEHQRGHGIAAALGTLALANTYLQHGSSVGELIAHVHVDNKAPRRLLTKFLGFSQTDRVECLDGSKAPPSMRRNQKGQVCGDVYQFQRSNLSTIADRIEHNNFARVPVDAEFLFMKDAAGMAQALRGLAKD